MASEKYMSFITGIHYTKSMLKALNNITFLLDPNWDLGANDVPTFPVCFFHVKSQNEIMESEISTKTALFYNDELSASDSNTTGAITNVVADNIVIKPKQYSLDLIIPYDNLSLLSDNYVLSPKVLGAVTNTLVTGNGSNNLGAKISSYLNVLSPYMAILKSILKAYLTASEASVTSVIESITATPDYNKNSLEAMWRNRAILKMKTWNSWRYKYVAITHMSITKENIEDGVYEAQLTVQEVPIMTIRKKGTKKERYDNIILDSAGKIISRILEGKEIFK